MRNDATRRHDGRRAPARARFLLVSLALHAPIGVAAAFAHALATEPAPRVHWSVESSLLAHAAPLPTAAMPPEVPFEPERDDPSEPPPLLETTATDAAAHAFEAEPPRTLLVEPMQTERKDPLAQAIAASLPRPRAPEHASDAPEPTPPAPAAEAASNAPASEEDRPNVLTPRPGSNPRPDYPESARRRGVEGVVLVRIEVDADGSPVECAIAGSSGSIALDDAALRAARKWRFENGPGSVDVPFRFAIEADALTARR